MNDNEDKKKKIRLLIRMGVIILLMFALIFLTVWLTGEREIEDFTAADRQVFGVFLAAELACLAALVFTVIRWSRLHAKGAKPTILLDGEPQNDTDKATRRRSILLFFAALILAALAEVAGILAGKGLPAERKAALIPLLVSGLLLPFLLLGASLLLHRASKKHFEAMRQEEGQRWLLSHREQAEQVAAQKLRLLGVIRRATGVYAVFLVLLGLADAFLIGLCTGGELLTVLLFLSLYPAASGLLRLRFAPPKSYFADSGCYVAESEFPQIYVLCRRAAEQLGRRGTIHVCLTPDVNAGIAEIGGEYSVQLGTKLLALFSSDEIWHVLLHEFAHLHAPQVRKENACLFWLEGESRCSFLFSLREPLFLWPDGQYGLQTTLYRYAASVGEETRADRAMAEHGDAAVAASGLLKLKYTDLYAWEHQAEDQVIPETIADSIHRLVISGADEIRTAIRERAPFYNELVEKEIISRSASHPTLKMRLETLGVSELRFSEGNDDPLFRTETEQAAKKLEEYLLGFNSEKDYSEYLEKRRKTVEDWEKAGCPLQEEEYPDTVGALKELGRVGDAMALCDRVIENLPGSTNALFMRGCYRLHRWDAGGIEDVYAALEDNRNYLEEGLEQIGSFCCMTGNREELERYREKAPVLAQKKQDEDEEICSLKPGDDLSGENLPPEMDGKIRDYIESLDEGQIDRVYLLHKQIGPEQYTSAMVVSFVPDAADEIKGETMHKVFLCLDNVPDWQFSLFDLDDHRKIRPDGIPGSLFYLGKKNRNPAP